MNENKARELLLDRDVFSMRELKSAFRAKAMSAHPDHGGDAEKFMQYQDAFDLLKTLATINGKEGVKAALQDGTLLTELGKGYPLTVSAKTCDSCDGRGYGSYTLDVSEKEITCPKCSGTGAFSYPCRACRGTGSHTNPRNGKPIGTCTLCEGSGRFYPLYKGKPKKRHMYASWLDYHVDYTFVKLKDGTELQVNKCRECGGDKRIWVPVKGTELFYTACDICGGVGEVKIYNPVIPRGLLTNVAV
jgi:hypothetical protein